MELESQDTLQDLEQQDDEGIDPPTLAQELTNPQPGELARAEFMGGTVVVCIEKQGATWQDTELCVAFANIEFHMHFHMKLTRDQVPLPELLADIERVLIEQYNSKSLQVYRTWGHDGHVLH